ncbi:MAG TPA: hypothetical protein PLF78_05305 [Caulobacter sp.]|nr:hypothetical protein [Caulobacter sp.]
MTVRTRACKGDRGRRAASRLLRATAGAVLAVLTVLLLGPATPLEMIGQWDKAAHFTAFGLTTWSLAVLAPRARRVVVAALAIALGGLTELLQGITGRDPSVFDFLADGLGVLVALGLWLVVRGFAPRRALSAD